MGKFDEFQSKELSNQGKRLLHEWMAIDKLCFQNKRISYIVRRRNVEGLPVEYEIIYRIKSFIGVMDPEEVEMEVNGEKITKTVRRPVTGDEHHMRISLPNNFPSAIGNPQLHFTTDIWHPNIRSAGKFKGRVCANEKELGVKTNLTTRIIRIGMYLQYQLYWAKDEYPYPEDKTVAEWVLEEAEPMRWINLDEGVFTDSGNLSEKDRTRAKIIVIPKESELKASGKNILRI